MKYVYKTALWLLIFVAGGIGAICALTLFFWGRTRIDLAGVYILTFGDVGISLKLIFGFWIIIGGLLSAILERYWPKTALVALAGTIVLFVHTFKIIEYWRGADDVSTLYEKEYKAFILPKQSSKRNLIILYLESMENDYRNYNINGNNLLPNLSKIANEHHSFEGFYQLEYTKATISAQVAGLCGLIYKTELKEYNLQSLLNDTLPNAVCMPDVLANAGYNTYFLKGASLDFALTGKFMAQHGFKELQGLHELPNYAKGNEWGIKDRELYNIAKQKIKWLSTQDNPFLVVMTTLDMHAPNEYLDDKCSKKFGDTRDIIRCTDNMAADFIHWIQKQDFYINTTIVLLGDHIFIGKNDIYPDKKKREIFNVIINPVDGLNERSHRWTTLDIAPTIMEAIGFKAPDFGLGRSLWQNEATLFEKYGEKLDLEFMKTSNFYKKLNMVSENANQKFEPLPIGEELNGDKIKPFVSSMVETKDNVFDAVWSDGLNFAVKNGIGLCIKVTFLLIKSHSDESIDVLLNNEKFSKLTFDQDEKVPFEREICLSSSDIPESGEVSLRFVRKQKSAIPFTYALGWKNISARIWTNAK